MKTYEFTKSMEMFKRATKVIPCGIYGHMSPAVTVPGYFPYYAEYGKGAHYWDIDGNEYIDYMCGYGPMVLGYAHPKVDEAVQEYLKKGDTFNHPNKVMVELAETLVDMVAIAEWAWFAKNGGDSTNFSLMVAREHTGRDKIILVKSHYHGVEPWAQAPGHAGVIPDDHKNFLFVEWNDFEGLKKVVEENKGQIAGMMAMPYHHITFADQVMPAEGYWQNVEQLLKKEGIVLIVDDVRAGFRLDLAGSNEYFGFKPDLICFSKAIANCYPLSALVGTEEMKGAASRVFHTGSFWFQGFPMAAALATLKEMKEINAPKVVREQGEKLMAGLKEAASSYNYNLVASGPPAIPYYRIADDNNLARTQVWCSEATRRGAFFNPHHNWFLSTAHTDEDIKKTIEIAHEAFKATRKEFGD